MEYINKTKELFRYFPKPFYDLKEGKGLGIVIQVLGENLDEAAKDVDIARAQFLLETAFGSHLQDHGQNLDVFRPRGFRMVDNTYRNLIKIMANSSKNIELCFERLLILFFGQNSLDRGICDAYSYRKNEIIIKIDESALIIASSRDLYGTTYLHPTNETSPFTGSWSGQLDADLPSGSTSFALLTVPTNMPMSGHIVFGSSSDYSEIKRFTRSGNIITFLSPTVEDHFQKEAIEGALNLDLYHGAFIYDKEISTTTIGNAQAGSTQLTISSYLLDQFPENGVCYIGDPNSSKFETKGFSRIGQTLNLMGSLRQSHTSGETIIIPCMLRKQKTTLSQMITKGLTYSELSVVNGADFPTKEYAIKIGKSFNNEEIVPLLTRKIGDNTKLIIDPSYVFQKNHNAGEAINLMARKTSPNADGTDWPFFLNDTDSLKKQFYTILKRIKASGIKLVLND